MNDEYLVVSFHYTNTKILIKNIGKFHILTTIVVLE